MLPLCLDVSQVMLTLFSSIAGCDIKCIGGGDSGQTRCEIDTI